MVRATKFASVAMPRFRLAIVDEFHARYRVLLERAELPGLNIIGSAERADASMREADIVLGQPDQIAQLFQHGGSPMWGQSTWAGVDALFNTDLPDGWTLTGVKGVFGAKISEFVMAYVLEHHRRIVERWNRQRRGEWWPESTGTLEGATMTIIGAGDIGVGIASKAQSFDMRVVGVTRSGKADSIFRRVFSAKELPLAVADARYVVSVLPGTPATQNLIGADVIGAMRADATLINVGRGSTVDEDALSIALTSGAIAGAVLDVFHREPLPVDHPFWRMPNVHVTSHTAGITPAESVAAIFVENYHRLLRGEPLRHVVDLELGY